MLTTGQPAPAFSLTNQRNEDQDLAAAFLIAPDGSIRNAWYKISPKDTPTRLLEALTE